MFLTWDILSLYNWHTAQTPKYHLKDLKANDKA